MSDSRIGPAIRTILAEMGEDPDRSGLADTPARVERMYAELTAGYTMKPGEERRIYEQVVKAAPEKNIRMLSAGTVLTV